MIARELPLAGESFALVGQQSSAPKCAACGMKSPMLVGELCEPCINQHAQDLIEAEARQRCFFQDYEVV